MFNCDAEGLDAACHAEVNFQRDGIMFAHCAAPYVSGVSPFFLLFKSAPISQFAPSDTSGHSKAVLEVSDAMQLQTLEGVPLVGLDPATVDHFGFAPSDLVRVSFAEAGLDDHGIPALADPRIEGRASPRRVFADVWSRILFYEPRDRDRTGTLSVPPAISLADLVAAVSFRGPAAVPTPQVQTAPQSGPPAAGEASSGGASASMGVGHIVARLRHEQNQGQSAQVAVEDDE